MVGGLLILILFVLVASPVTERPPGTQAPERRIDVRTDGVRGIDTGISMPKFRGRYSSSLDH